MEDKVKTPAEAKQEKGEKAAPATPPAPTGGFYAPLASLRDDMDRIFNRYLEGWPMQGFGTGLWGRGMRDLFPGFTHAPNADITETDKGYEVSVELPGMDEKDIELTVTDDSVTLTGEKRETQETEEKNYHLTERRYGSFRRTFPVPPGVDPEKVKAAFSKGVLTVTMPKSKEARSKRRKVEVKAS